MQWEFVLALVIAIPVILFPVAFVWYLNAGGLVSAIRGARAKKAARVEKAEVVTPQTTSVPRIREVQVFRKQGETGLTEAMGKQSKTREEVEEEEKEKKIR